MNDKQNKQISREKIHHTCIISSPLKIAESRVKWMVMQANRPLLITPNLKQWSKNTALF